MEDQNALEPVHVLPHVLEACESRGIQATKEGLRGIVRNPENREQRGVLGRQYRGHLPSGQRVFVFCDLDGELGKVITQVVLDKSDWHG